MNEIQSEWYTFILPLTTIPSVVFWVWFMKSVIPRWFKSLEAE